MTLPFRRRHHDAETGHDRARMLMSEGLLVTLAPDDATWLARHLDGCAECGRDWKAFRADHRLLRAAREQPPEPPRDLWARTSAALDREAQRRGRPAGAPAAGRQPARSAWRALPLGAIAGALVVAVLVGSRMFDGQVLPPASAAPGTNVANGPTAGPTALALPNADPVAIFRETGLGAWELVYEDVKEVCLPSDRNCVPRQGGKGQSIDLGDRPSHVALGDDQLAIASEGDDGSGGEVLVVPVRGPDSTPTPATEPPTQPPSTDASPAPSPAATPPGSIAIASGVHVIGDVAYSEDGRWLAFSATADDATGPDLYIWSVGDAKATVVTNDHQTYFASWHDGRILASRVELAGAAAGPGASGEPGASEQPAETGKPGRGNEGGGNQGGNQGGKPRATETPAAPSPEPTAPGSPAGSPGPEIEGHPMSFLLDPETLDRTDLAQADVWLPVLDPSGRSVVYWSGTLRSTDGDTWTLGTGELVLDRWSTGDGTDTPTAGPTSGAADATNGPAPTAPPIGPAGRPTTLVPGPKATFEVAFDPEGARLAIWVSEDVDEEIGRLSLLVLDPATGELTTRAPLRGAAALRRFTLERSRLAWVTPRGQDGHESLVQVLGWKGNDFGERETEPATDLYLP